MFGFDSEHEAGFIFYEMSTAYTTTDRTIYYYDLNFNYYKEHEDTKPFKEIFKHITQLGIDQEPSRIIKHRSGRLFCPGFKFFPTKSQIQGKIYFVREDIFPQIINLKDENIREFQLGTEEGMLETTHFIIDYSFDDPKIGIEYNHFGARITDLTHYTKRIGQQQKIIRSCEPKMIIQDRLKDLKRRINRISKVRVRVHKNNIARIKSADNKLASALFHAQNFSLSDEVELSLMFDYKARGTTSAIKEVVYNVIDSFVGKPQTMHDFQAFEVEAEDDDMNNTLEAFNLLLDKVKSEILVKKKLKSRIIDSKDFFAQCENEIAVLFK